MGKQKRILKVQEGYCYINIHGDTKSYMVSQIHINLADRFVDTVTGEEHTDTSVHLRVFDLPLYKSDITDIEAYEEGWYLKFRGYFDGVTNSVISTGQVVFRKIQPR